MVKIEKLYGGDPILKPFLDKYGFSGEGEDFLFYLETNTQEGDIVLSDFISDQNACNEIESKYEGKIRGYDEIIEYDNIKDNEEFIKAWNDLDINIEDLMNGTVEIIGCIWLSPDAKEALYIGYQFQSTTFGMKAISYEMN